MSQESRHSSVVQHMDMNVGGVRVPVHVTTLLSEESLTSVRLDGAGFRGSYDEGGEEEEDVGQTLKY